MVFRTRPLVVSLLALLACAFLTLPTFAAEEELLSRARELVEESRPYNKRSGDTDLDHGERKKARREAYTRLKEARSLYDRYLDANPGKEEQLDAEYCQVASMLYWVKKMASLREFDDDPEPEPEKKPEPPKPEPPKPDPNTPDGTDPPPAEGDDTAGTPDALPDFETQMEDLARKRYAELQALRAANPGDVPRLHDAYEQFLVDFDLPDLPEYQKAMLELGQLADRLKTVFKDEVGADPEDHPDTKKSIDSDNIGRVVSRLTKQMRDSDEHVRRRAARMLGELGSGAGSYVLAKGLADRDDEVSAISKKGLINIGGARACYNLIKLYRDSSEARQQDCVDIFRAIAAKGEVDAFSVSVPLGRFVLSRRQGIAGEALDLLVSLGPPGAPGLVEGLETRLPAKKLEIIRGLGTVKHYPAALQVGRYLLAGDNPTMVSYRNAAKQSLKAMGIRTVPYLIPLLGSKRHKMHVAAQLREMTGARLGSKKKLWKKWWKENKPADAK